ncbi:amidohydrolase [Henriciella sp.]|uniref:amidohydrolase n=1 Tax=Henriciella sp. TaxID=1968823 RepID=UPI0025C6E59E|nr:amidohydrolase [Henriciella sp.]|tara:strand:+ start:10484 stop:12169 length:1686 start_codon:yes stop_codon:yes gene_type:complete
MLRNTFILSAIVLSACAQPSMPRAAGPSESAETVQPVAARIFASGTIYTGVEGETVDTVAVDDDGRIVWTGSIDDLDAEVDIEGAEFVWLDNNFMYPGFTDSHAHLLGIGQRELSLDLADTASLEELVTRIEAEAGGLGDEAIIVGRGWIETDWPEGRMPAAADLDAAVGDRLVILMRADGHALVASTAALNAAGIDETTPDPEGGKIERDSDGKATGILIDNAMTPVWGLVAEPSEEEIRRAYVEGSRVYAERGWTGLHNMSVPPAHAPLMAELDAAGEMPVRIYNALSEDGFPLAAGHEYETDTISNRAVKLYMDGALGSRGALLIEPYSDRPDTNGLSLLEPEGLHNLMMKAEEEDVQLAIHAIGDLANRRILNVYEELDISPDRRWRIEHTQILHPDDIARIPELGLIASMQPSHAIGDLKFAPARLGFDRLDGAYAWQNLLDAGAVIAGGSDAPVEVGSPLIEFYAAVAREDLEGNSGEGWHPEQALSRQDALALFTSSAAYAAFMEDDLGTIEPGKLADFTVFDRDLMTVPEDEILEANAVMTVVNGEIVWSAAE